MEQFSGLKIFGSPCVFLLLRARERGLRRFENLEAGTLRRDKDEAFYKEEVEHLDQGETLPWLPQVAP